MKRSTNVGSFSASFRGKTFTATILSNDIWRALNTEPIAPRPTVEISSNPPSRLRPTASCGSIIVLEETIACPGVSVGKSINSGVLDGNLQLADVLADVLFENLNVQVCFFVEE